MIDTKNKLKKITKGDESLIIEDILLEDMPDYLKKFNDLYTKFCNFDEDVNSIERLECGEKAAMIVAKNFDFTNALIKDKKQKYIDFAREMLYELSSRPHNNPETMIILIQALYGQTNIAYSHTGDHKAVNIDDGNAWVTYLERQTKNRTLKAYALALRSYQYIVNGEDLGMSVKDRINKSEKDLIYATKWDPNNYLAYICLGLIYMDSASSKYNLEKSINNFNTALSFEKHEVFLDNYLSKEEKSRFMSNARNKVNSLKNL